MKLQPSPTSVTGYRKEGVIKWISLPPFVHDALPAAGGLFPDLKIGVVIADQMKLRRHKKQLRDQGRQTRVEDAGKA